MNRKNYELGRALIRTTMDRARYLKIERRAIAAGMDPAAMTQEYIRVMSAAGWMAKDDPLRDALHPLFAKIDGPRTAGRMLPPSRLP